MMSTPRARGGWFAAASVALMTTIGASPRIAAQAVTNGASDVAVKAAFLFNFAKFTEWSALSSGVPIVFCIVGSEPVAAALLKTMGAQKINGHALEVRRAQKKSAWRDCHLLFIADAETSRSTDALSGIKTLPVLTVSDGMGFSQTGGIIEFYVEAEYMRFAINVDAADSAGLHLSSRLLGLAKIVRR